jgi:predicted nucleic acid-binding protein
MSDRVFVDTNVLVYLFDAAEPDKQQIARQRLESEQRRSDLVVSTQVLQELYVCLTRGKHPIASAETAERAVRDAAALIVVQVGTAHVLEAVSQSRRSRLSFWDALILRAAAAAGCRVILTEDLNAGQVVEGVRIENPFA